jgi:hypothetical protein
VLPERLPLSYPELAQGFEQPLNIARYLPVLPADTVLGKQQCRRRRPARLAADLQDQSVATRL